MRKDPEVRFWRMVSIEASPAGCLLWLGARDGAGYGVFRVDGTRLRKAHAVAWELEHGPVPPGLVLMHACDVRHCVNVVHLRVGTPQQNMDDMVAKGRAGNTAPAMSPAQREELRAALLLGEESPELLAQRFKISRERVYQVARKLRNQGLLD